MNMIEAMKARKSCRSYSDRALENDMKTKVAGLVNREWKGPFGASPSFAFMDFDVMERREVQDLGSYGMVRGARYFVAGWIKKSPTAFMDFGNALERMILEFTRLGLGTCWLGGTFGRANFIRKLELEENTDLPAVTPVGWPEPKEGVMASLVRTITGANSRRRWADLFFCGGFGTPLTEEGAGGYAVPLEMVRIAPSAVNGQPWRVVKEDGGSVFHFFINGDCDDPRVKEGRSWMHLDIGAAMAHFELACGELGLNGGWTSGRFPECGAGRTYIRTWEG